MLERAVAIGSVDALLTLGAEMTDARDLPEALAGGGFDAVQFGLDRRHVGVFPHDGRRALTVGLQ